MRSFLLLPSTNISFSFLSVVRVLLLACMVGSAGRLVGRPQPNRLRVPTPPPNAREQNRRRRRARSRVQQQYRLDGTRRHELAHIRTGATNHLHRVGELELTILTATGPQQSALVPSLAAAFNSIASPPRPCSHWSEHGQQLEHVPCVSRGNRVRCPLRRGRQDS